MEILKEYLKSKPSVERVYLNEKNEWLFYPRPGYREVSRDEILNEKKKSEK
jgi:hypothetical protein